MRALLDERTVAAASEPADLLPQVVQEVLGGMLSSPWSVGLFAFLAVHAILRAVRTIVHGRHRKDPLRRFTGADRAVIFGRAGNRCEQHSWLLGRCRETERLQADHVHPHSRGGATAIENGQVLCARHNTRKGAHVPWNWELTRLARRRTAYFAPGTPVAVVRFRRPVVQDVGT